MLSLLGERFAACHLLLGWLADITDKPKLIAAGMLVGTVSLLLLAFGEAEWTL